MKKIASPLLAIVLSLALFTCNNEPLDPAFQEEVPDTGASIECLAALQANTIASSNYIDASINEVNYTEACNAYAITLQNVIDTCGDPNNGFQTLLITLGDCSAPIEPDSCEGATIAVSVAANNYNNATEELFTQYCNGYIAALENQIEICGDADGSIQATIDGLGDCSNSNDESLLLKKMIWTETDGTIETEEFFYEGNNLTSITVDGVLLNSYEYENNILTRINSYSENGDLIDYVITEYNSNNQLIVYTVYIIDDNQGYRYELTYNADETITEKKYTGDLNSQTNLTSEYIITIQNNQILMETFGANDNTSYSYDTKNGIYKNISNLQTINLINIDFSGYIDGGQNNITSLTENENGNILYNEEYNYTYNSNNYPETSNDYVDGQLDTTREYIYY